MLSLISSALILTAVACGNGDDANGGADEDREIDTITLADAGWDSIRVHNSITQRILEEGYGYDTDVMTGSTAATIQGLRQGDIQVYTEIWTDNIQELWEESLESGDVIEVSTNFDDNRQGLFVPTYVIEGDEERGIEPMAPDLRTVEDLKNYPDLFEDPEEAGMGRIYGAPSDWALSEYIEEKVHTYGLEDTMNHFRPGSDAALVTTLVDAYESGEPWVGYYWEPTWVTAVYDLTLLEEPAFDQEIWDENKGTEFPPNDVVVGVWSELEDIAPEVVEFLSNYETSSALTDEALAYMRENDAEADEAADWWMLEHQDIWMDWLPEEVAEDVLASLQ